MQRRGRPPKYDWADWFASKEPIHVDCDRFEVAQSSFQQQALNQARKMDVRLSTRRCGNRQHENCLVLHTNRRPRGDWDRLLNGQPHIVWYSEIRPTLPESWVTAARWNARKRGLSVEVDRTQNEAGMVVRSIPRRVR